MDDFLIEEKFELLMFAMLPPPATASLNIGTTIMAQIEPRI